MNEEILRKLAKSRIFYLIVRTKLMVIYDRVVVF